MTLDDGTATAGQYDPAQAATNARKMVSDPSVVAAIGPQMSGAGKAMAPILSQGDLATITPCSTNPDITDPKFAEQYRPAGKADLFPHGRRPTPSRVRTWPTSIAETLKVKTVYILDDSGAYGVGLADAFQEQAEKKGIKVLGRDRLDPKAADYTAILTKIKSLNPDALYYGGVGQAGVKLAKQAYDIIPKVIKAGGDGVYGAGHPHRRRLPRGRRLVRDHRLAARHRRHRRWRPGSRAFMARSASRRTTTRSPPMTRPWSSSPRSSAGRRRQAGHPRGSARRDPDRQGDDAAGPGLVRRQRRPEGPARSACSRSAGQGKPPTTGASTTTSAAPSLTRLRYPGRLAPPPLRAQRRRA